MFNLIGGMNMEDELIVHNSSGLYVDDSVSICKRNPTSIINWQTGRPTSGEYKHFIVTTKEGKVEVSHYKKKRIGGIKWIGCEVVAWCNLEDIEPYNESSV